MTTASSTPSEPGEVPSGLPDPATLARLATELFAEHALHVGEQVTRPAGPTAGFPATGTPLPAVGGVEPEVIAATPLPAGVPTLLDDAAEVRHAARDATPAGPTVLVPSQVQRAATPAPVPTPTTAYYFLDGATAGPPVPAVTSPPPPWPPAPPPASAYYFLSSPSTGTAGAAPTADLGAPFDVEAVRRDFPILEERVNGRRLVWFDNAATTQKPRAVIDRLAHFYEHENSNIHRGAHELATRATDAYEAARGTVARFLGAPSSDDIVFVRGSTEAINLVAQSWGRANVGPGDEIVLSHLEHHANIVPWQQLAAEKGAILRVIPVDDDGQVLLDDYRRLLGEHTKLVAVTHVSNVLGTIVPVREIVEQAHAVGARVLVDGAQAAAHLPVDVQTLDVDFYLFSGHKVFGPTGIGALYGKQEVLESMPPWEGGGNMIRDVTFERTLYEDPPTRFEAGTGNIADAVGLGTALDYVQRLGRDNISRYEHALCVYATQQLSTVPGLRLIGTAPDKAAVLSFVLDGHEPGDVATALNREGIAVRAGHHCAQPILRRFGLEETVRPSLSIYNTCDEIDLLVASLFRLSTATARSGRSWPLGAPPF